MLPSSWVFATSGVAPMAIRTLHCLAARAVCQGTPGTALHHPALKAWVGKALHCPEIGAGFRDTAGVSPYHLAIGAGGRDMAGAIGVYETLGQVWPSYVWSAQDCLCCAPAPNSYCQLVRDFIWFPIHLPLHFVPLDLLHICHASYQTPSLFSVEFTEVCVPAK